MSSEMESAVSDFHKCVHVNDKAMSRSVSKTSILFFSELKQVLEDMAKLTARSRWRRIAGYGSDPMKITASKEKLQHAIEIIKVGPSWMNA